ncbi:MAG: two-component system, chemotaxis family, sensor kinase CheA [Clostridia bacterium]|nr:two-component system, chemotaxis family, sensor kinase CheA [Clostridia bacterium]
MSVNEYLNLFLEEAREHLQILNDELLKLEQNPADKGAVDEIFRAAHTLKGMSATMGYEKIAELTHKMENILDELRESKIVFSENLSELLFKCVDALETMVENVATENSEKFNISGILNDLKNFNQKDIGITQNHEMGVNNKLELNDYDHNLIKVAQERNFNIYEIKVEIAPECVMKSVRAFMVFNSLEKLGEVVKSVPPVQDIEDEKFEKDFIVVLITDKTQNEIAKVLNQISEVEVKEIGSLGLINGSTPQETNSVQEISSFSKTEDAKKGINNKISQTVRVDISKLDKLMNLVGELVINKTRLEQIFRTNDLSALNETAEQIDRISADLQTVVMDVRMVPIEQVFNRFPRMVRDLAKELGKEINLIMEGKETELDRTVIDEIADPLVHLIRNSIDHGIESLEERRKKGKPAQGTLRLSAKQEGNSIIILVEDDGQGINLEKVKSKALEKGIITTNQLEQMDENSIVDLIFSPGFSTASQITDISGRGVGLDVVRSKIQSLKGNVAVESKEGQGSKFTIKLPLTLAIIQALMVKVGPEIYAIPLANINETTSINLNDIKKVQDQEVMVLRNHVLPLVRLEKVLEVPNMDNYESEELFVVVVRKNNKFIGLIVNELIGQQEIVISSLGKFLNGVPGIAGAAILGDGTVSLILDIGTLF